MPASPDRTARSPWWWISTGLSLPYAAGVLGFFALRISLPRLPATLAAASYGAPFFFAPLVVLLPLALLGRSRPAVISTLLVLALFLGLFLPHFLPRLDPPPPLAGKSLHVMTYNVGGGRGAPEALVAAIEEQDADLVALQELTPATSRALQEGLGKRFPFSILEPEQGDTGLLSRYPILASERFRPAGFGRTALQARLDVDGVAMHVIVVHPHPPTLCPPPAAFCHEELERQIDDIASRAALLPGPVLVLGDFNMSDQTRAYDRMAGTLRDAFREAGWGFGFTFPVSRSLSRLPVPGPLVRIDYVFYSNELRASQAAVGCSDASDHCFVVAQLERRASQAATAWPALSLRPNPPLDRLRLLNIIPTGWLCADLSGRPRR